MISYLLLSHWLDHSPSSAGIKSGRTITVESAALITSRRDRSSSSRGSTFIDSIISKPKRRVKPGKFSVGIPDDVLAVLKVLLPKLAIIGVVLGLSLFQTFLPEFLLLQQV
jgi:hypothetical protein